mgnify:FL=1
MSKEMAVRKMAEAIWMIRREYEDRCDMSLDDMGSDHPVWEEARAALAAIKVDFSPCNIQHASYNNVDCYAISDVKVILSRHGLKVK